MVFSMYAWSRRNHILATVDRELALVDFRESIDELRDAPPC